jgi:hypothetical protein
VNTSTVAVVTLSTTSCISRSAAACPNHPAWVEMAMSAATAIVLNTDVTTSANAIFLISLPPKSFIVRHG